MIKTPIKKRNKVNKSNDIKVASQGNIISPTKVFRLIGLD
jgi:hypothetical protein